MKFFSKIYISVLVLALGWANYATCRDFTDMAGRTVNIPDRAQRVYSPAPPGGLMLYTLNPGVLCTFTNYPGSAVVGRDLLDPRVRTLPNIGFLSGEGAMASLENLMRVDPDLIIMFPKNRYETENFAVQNRVIAALDKLNVPYVYAYAEDLRDYPAAYETFAEALGIPERGQILAAYIRDALADAERVTAKIPAEQRPKVYYAAGPDGLSTTSGENSHGIILKLAGDVGVYRGPDNPGTPAPHVKIPLEQVIAYEPDVMFVSNSVFYQSLTDNSAWRQVKAVREGRVYLVPRDPWNWFDNPPSFMAAIGLKWTLNLLYPEEYPLDIVDEAVKFYRLFLWSDVTHDEMRKIIYPENR